MLDVSKCATTWLSCLPVETRARRIHEWTAPELALLCGELKFVKDTAPIFHGLREKQQSRHITYQSISKHIYKKPWINRSANRNMAENRGRSFSELGHLHEDLLLAMAHVSVLVPWESCFIKLAADPATSMLTSLLDMSILSKFSSASGFKMSDVSRQRSDCTTQELCLILDAYASKRCFARTSSLSFKALTEPQGLRSITVSPLENLCLRSSQ